MSLEQFLNPACLRPIAQAMHLASHNLRLPFRSQVWKGKNGNWLGVGTGSSIDFQDFRTYQWGDDPRYIDWRAAARTGQYYMKLFREEVCPAVDFIIDCSPSMFLPAVKAARTLELVYFCLESALQAEASTRVFLAAGNLLIPCEVESILNYRWPVTKLCAGAYSSDPSSRLDLSSIPLRKSSLRLVLSDLLFPGSPQHQLASLSSGKGWSLLLVPFSRQEAEPDWNGSITFIDCENGRQQYQFVDASFMEQYSSAYARHFNLWRENCLRYQLRMARVCAEAGFYDALCFEALPLQAIEPCT